MSTQVLLPVQAAAMMDDAATDKQFARAHDLFHAKRTTPRNRLADARLTTVGSEASAQGVVQFNLIGHAPTDSKYSDMMNENANNLLSIGGLIHGYMNSNYPNIDAKKLDIATWRPALEAIPCTDPSRPVLKEYNKSINGVSVSGEFLSMIAKAVITEGASLLADFTSFLRAQGDVVFSLKTEGNSYKAIDLTYISYLVDNNAGGYFDYAAILAREIEFTAGFMELKGACVTAQSVNIHMKYQELKWALATAKIRNGGARYKDFQELIDAGDTEEFSRAKNLFHKPKTPQKDLTPRLDS